LLPTLVAATALAEPKPQLAQVGKSLLEERFDAPALPDNWKPGGRPNSFTIVDGALRGVAQPDDNHGPSIGVPITARNVTVAFRVKFEHPGYFLFLIDGDSQFGGQAHLLRFALAPEFEQLAQDRGSLESKSAQAAARAAAQKAGTTVPVPTKEQLADPKFYRTESLARQPAKPADQWHDVLVELNGNDVVAQMDELPPLKAKGTVLDAPKSRLVFLIGNSGTMLVDDVRVWENQAKP
jgi:hypothetical protein